MKNNIYAIDYFISKLKEKYNVLPKDNLNGFFNIIEDFNQIVNATKEIELEKIKQSYDKGYLDCKKNKL